MEFYGVNKVINHRKHAPLWGIWGYIQKHEIGKMALFPTIPNFIFLYISFAFEIDLII